MPKKKKKAFKGSNNRMFTCRRNKKPNDNAVSNVIDACIHSYKTGDAANKAAIQRSWMPVCPPELVLEPPRFDNCTKVSMKYGDLYKKIFNKLNL